MHGQQNIEIFWDVTWSRLIVVTDISGRPAGPVFKGQVMLRRNPGNELVTNAA